MFAAKTNKRPARLIKLGAFFLDSGRDSSPRKMEATLNITKSRNIPKLAETWRLERFGDEFRRVVGPDTAVGLALRQLDFRGRLPFIWNLA